MLQEQTVFIEYCNDNQLNVINQAVHHLSTAQLDVGWTPGNSKSKLELLYKVPEVESN